MGYVIRIASTAVALWISTLVLSERITLDTPSIPKKIGTLLAVAVIFGLVNGILRPIIKTVGCAVYWVTLGLVSFLVNGLLFLLTSWIADRLHLPFHVSGVWTAILGALLVSVVSVIINGLVPDRFKRINSKRR